MPDTLPGIQPVGVGEWMRLGIYAWPGAGKTSLVGTAADAGRTLIIKSSLDLMPSRVLKKPNLDTFEADTWEKMLEVQDYCRMAQDFPYLWVWWDCVSIHQDVLLDDIWAGTIFEKPARAFKADGKPNLTPQSGLDRGEYGRNMERLQQWLRFMVGTKRFHFGMAFHPHEGQHPTNDEGGTLLRPYVQGKQMTEKFAGYTNMLGFLEVMEGGTADAPKKWRRFHVEENARFYAKDQFDAFLPKGYLDEPTIPKIMAAAEKARGKPLGTVSSGRATSTVTAPRRGRGTTKTAPSRGRGSRQ